MTRASHRALQAASPRHNQLTLDGRRKPKPMPLLEPVAEPTGQDRAPIERTARKQRITFRALTPQEKADAKARRSHALAVTDADRAHFKVKAVELAAELGKALKHV